MMNEEGERIRKCSRCRLTKLLETYFSKNTKGNYNKTCDKCRKYAKNCYTENIEELKESRKCEHNIYKFCCKICSGPIKVTIMNWIGHSRQTDKKHNRYDPVKFIDTDFLKGLVEDSDKKCVYCKCDMQFLERNKTLCTIERLDNELGHNKDNVTLACFGCNTERQNCHTFEEFIAIKQLQISDI